MVKRVALLGSTGSIGTNTLRVLNSLSDRFELVSLCAGRNAELLCEQAERWRPKRVCIAQGAKEVQARLAPLGIEVLEGSAGLQDLSVDPDTDLIINGLAAGVGLRPTLSAVRAGKDAAIANKETLVVAGHLVTDWAKQTGATLLPIDSETTPLWQSLQETNRDEVKRILLPASGGPFFDYTQKQMASVSRDQALNHPTWQMGPKITIDSATLMNKGFEVIEAQWFLDLPVSKIDVIIHRQSIVHCLIEYVDGGMMAHLSTPDMQLPIHQVLVHPEKLPTQVERLDLTKVGTLSFFQPDTERFPCLQLAYQAVEQGGTAPAVLNAANEVAVYAFLDGRIGFLDIPRVIAKALDEHEAGEDTLEAVFDADRWGRDRANTLICSLES
ncbi:MAG: 1-deoxy-D-xylulose-5-phosphate reductoisomerase [Gemmatimonadota bacterium]|nr:1-deoxy-D-xylulose-5-phosphate reductoisomerase [Gemmatimonadota bacterium]